MFESIAAVSLFLCLMYLLLKWLNAPYERVVPPHSLGFRPPSGREKAEWIESVRGLRKLGRLPPVYPNGWFCVSESRQLSVGQVKNVHAFGKTLLLWRGFSGKPFLTDAYCPHLGANIGIGGKVYGDNVECPFHGWKFDGSGACVEIPYADKVPKTANIKHWTLIERNSNIYTWFHSEGVEPTWEIPALGIGSWTYGGRTEHYVNSHIQEVPENGGDLAHLNVIHKAHAWLGNRVDLQEAGKWLKHKWTAQWEQGAEKDGAAHIGFLTVDHALLLFGRKVPLADVHVDAQQIGPGIVYLLMKTSVGPVYFLQHLLPEQPLMQRLTHQCMLKYAPAGMGRILINLEAAHVERDITIWNNKAFLSKPLLVKEDALIAKHRRWFNQFYSPSSPRLQLSHLINQNETINDKDW